MKLGSLPSRSLLFRLFSSSTTLYPRRAIVVANSFSTTTSSASGSNLSSSSSRRHHHDEDSRSVRVAVWWDFNNCNLPATANVFKLAQSITGAIRSSGIKGPITITAFGDVLSLPRSNQEALSSTGITLTHIPQGGKNSADRSLITDLMCWVSQNPPPAHIFLISTDEAFASVLHRLRMSNYNVLLSSRSSSSASPPGVLCSAASIMWDWDGLVKGDSVTGKYFNQPPDGPYNSWYGHYRVPLLDPFATTSTSDEEVVSVKASCTVPKEEVVDKIRMVLSLFPKGLSVSELRGELVRSNVALDKEFYGYKSFTRFLQSMPDVFQVNRGSDGLFVVRGAGAEKAVPKRVDSSSGLVTVVDEKIREKVSTPKLMTDVELGGERKGRDVSLEKKQENDKNVKEKAPESSQESIMVKQKDVKADEKAVETDQGSLIAGSEDSMEDGFFQKLKRIWSGSPEMESELLSENKTASGSGDKDEGVVNDGKALDKKDLKSSSQGADSMSQISPSSAEDVKTGTDEAGNSDKNATPGVFSQLLKSFKFWDRNKGLSNDSSGTEKLDVFANESSWSDVESFIHSPRGYIVVSHSRTREMIAKNLQREGPSCLKQLDESTMLHLVTLLISDKKWIEENPSSSPPFSVIKSSNTLSNGHASNGLISIFSDLGKPQDGGEKRFKNVAHAGVSNVGYKSNALADCQKLIKKMTEKSPEGYSLIRFRKDFLEEYGYHLAVEKLGYKNLQSLIQVMPGVRISSGYVLPSTSGGKSTTKEDESDSSFEELGPVSEAATSNHQTMNRKLPVCESSDSEDEDSGTERDIPRKTKQVMSENDKDSSLLQILDSYYKSSGEVKMEQQPVERKLVNNVRKPKPSKTYSFVKDSEVQ